MRKVYPQNMIVYKRKHRFDNLYTVLRGTGHKPCKVWANWNYFIEYAIIAR